MTATNLPDLYFRPLDQMDSGDMSELGCAPVFGVVLDDYDCCSTETWVVVGPSLDDAGAPMLLVEQIEARQNWYNDPIHWEVAEALEAPTLADAVQCVLDMNESYRYGRRCTCP